MTLALPARAKLNLDLEVLRRSEDGFHDLRTTMQAIDLHDVLEISHAGQTELTITGLSTTSSADNLVLKAHSAIENAARRKLPTRFHLHKRIPPGSGMGGASSDAAVALKGLSTLHQIDLDLAGIALEIGSDVPFFLTGGTARAEGRGEKLTRLPTADTWFAVAWPGIELSTAAVYRAWEEMQGEPPNHLRRAAEHVEPRIKEFARRLGENGGAWQMTGSGSAFFLMCESDEQARRVTKGVVDAWTAVTRAVGPWD